jgi:threonylcarbamoyladenosine tRNA methylthiotransferase MtaB
MRIAFATLGCKINQFETDALQQDLESKGNTIVPFHVEADVYVINTCSVTAKSDYQCRQAIRSAIRRNDSAKIVVTGCYAETRPNEIRDIPGVDLVIGNRDKASIADHIMSEAPAVQDQNKPLPDAMSLTSVRSRTRGFLKIQDGCDNRCSYCIVPQARGRSRSVLPPDVLNGFERLVTSGYAEVVLTGIHIGTYGSDLGTGTTLTEMLRKLLSARGKTRIRLSSIEPKEITEDIVGFLGNGLCRHLHIPLQSGDDTILTSMRRHYTSGFYLSLLEKISMQVPGVALGADIMVGFPGEGEKEFQNTLSLVERSPLTHVHVFSYSPRPGTPAAELTGQVPEKIKKERNEEMRNLGIKKNLLFRQQNIGAELFAVVEDKRDASSGLYTGLTDNYIRVQVADLKKEDIGRVVRVSITEATDRAIYANVL